MFLINYIIQIPQENQMNSQTNQKYIRKLIKLVQQKQQEIQNLKKQLRSHKATCNVSNNHIFNEQITSQLGNTSHQLKQVTEQILSMESKMLWMEEGWKEEAIKSENYEIQINLIKRQNQQLKSKVDNLEIQKDKLGLIINEQKDKWMEQIQQMKNTFIKSQLLKSKYEQQMQHCKNQLIVKEKLLIKVERQWKEKEQFFKNEIQIYDSSIKLLQLEIQEKVKQIEDKVNHTLHLKQKLNKFQQFSYQICQYIETIFHKYCTYGALRSSKKIIKENDGYQGKFQNTFKKIIQIQTYLEDLLKRYDAIKQRDQLPNETLENLSVIVQSIQQKLQLCDLTQILQKEQQQNQEQLLKNLQNECQNENRSKMVELVEIKQVLKMTKDVNRQLMEQINQKQYIIQQCKRYYENLIKHKGQADNRKIKVLLNLKI